VPSGRPGESGAPGICRRERGAGQLSLSGTSREADRFR